MNKSTWFSLCEIVFLTISGAACTSKPEITQDELVRRTQELVDAVGTGDQAPWKRFYADDCLVFDVKGKNKNKSALISEIAALPKGVSGNIKVINAQSHIEANVAILTYDLNETEIIFMQVNRARYHETDTWLRHNCKWQIVAAEVLRYYEDPVGGAADSRMFPDFVGNYKLAPEEKLTMSQDGGKLFWQTRGKPMVELIPEAAEIFFRTGVEGRVLFLRNKSDRVNVIERRNNEDLRWKKVATAGS